MPPVPTRGARSKPARKTTAGSGAENGAGTLTEAQVARLTAALEAARDGDFSVRLRAAGPLAEVAAAFNTLLRKLQHRQGENERFVADLVHELKNPVAAVRAAAEALTSSEGSVDEARARRLGKVLVDSSARLDALVSQLLELARAEGGLASDERAEVDLAALARGLVESIRARYEAVEIAVEAPPEATVIGVPCSSVPLTVSTLLPAMRW